MLMLTLWFGLYACAGTPPPEPPLPQELPEATTRPELPPGGLKPMREAPLEDPAGMLAACRDRIEGAETAGECSSDADCTRTGCSSEVCVSKATSMQGIMTTCEVLPCFAALDTCGCHEGLCTWTPRPAGVPGTPSPQQ